MVLVSGMDRLLFVAVSLSWHGIRSCAAQVVVLIEGIDAVTSYNFQARHSYTVDDIVWNQTFAPCVSVGDDGGAEIDFDQFHITEPVKNGQEAQHSLHRRTPSHA